ncbi:MAG: acyl-ACP thioesterase [Oscillospiraceae bacterium]|jgi:acyl-ACP thioesterase|nr:acyl-ACP thioesterase [Oscillospiraceae bacterium]
MPQPILEKRYTVGAGETDPAGRCRASALNAFLQDIATEHAQNLGVSRESLLANGGVFWVLARSWFSLTRPILFGEEILIRTWHRGARGATLYRDFDLEIDGQPVGEAVTSWVLADWETRRPVRPTAVSGVDVLPASERAKTVSLGKFPRPDGLTPAGERRAMYSDLDVNNHVNNVRYTDFVCDALHLERRPEAWVSALQVNFQAQVEAGAFLRLYIGELPDGRFFVSGLDEGGAPRFEAAGRLAAPASDEA